MIILFKLIVLTFICVMGLKIALSDGMILGRFGNWMERKEEKGWFFLNLFICPWCMATLQSIVAHGFAFGLGVLPLELNWQLLIRWPLVVMGASFLAGNAWNIYETLSQIREKNTEEKMFYYNVNTNYEEPDENLN